MAAMSRRLVLNMILSARAFHPGRACGRPAVRGFKRVDGNVIIQEHTAPHSGIRWSVGNAQLIDGFSKEPVRYAMRAPGQKCVPTSVRVGVLQKSYPCILHRFTISAEDLIRNGTPPPGLP